MNRAAGVRRQLATSGQVLRAVLRNPSLRRVLAAFLLFNASVYGTWVAVLVYAYASTGPASVGVVALVQLLPAAAFAPLAASLADRLPRERVLLAGYVAQAVTFGATGVGMLAGAPPPLVYLVAAAGAAATTLTRPAQGSLLPGLSRTPEELTAANSLAGTMEGAGVLVGPLAGALILATATPGTAWVAGGLAFAVGALLVARLPVRRVPPGRSHAGEAEAGTGQALVAEGPASLVGGGLRALARNGETRLLVALLAVRMLTSGAIDVLFVLLALQVLGTGASGAGFLTAALGLGTVLGGGASLGLVGRQRLAPAMGLSALAWGTALVLAGVMPDARLAAILVALGGVGFAALDVTGRTVLQRVTPDHLLARVLGALEGVGLLSLAIGSAAVPLLVDAVGVPGALVGVALLLPASVALAWVPLRRIDHHAHVPLRELDLLRRSPIFAPLPAPQLESVARRTRWLALEAGTVLIREGDPGDRLYVLESGRLGVSQGGRPLGTVGAPGAYVGEIALLRNIPRTATVTVTSPSVLLALERADFLAAVTGHEFALATGERSAAGHLARDAGGGETET